MLLAAAAASASVLAAYDGGMLEGAYAGSSGSADSELVLMDGSYHMLKVTTDPAILSGDEEHVKLTLFLVNVDAEPSAPVSGVEYGLRFASSQDPSVTLAALDVYSPGDAVTILMTPSEGDSSVSGDTAAGGAWLASADSPAVLRAPVFLEGGLVHIAASITSIDSRQVAPGTEFETMFSMGEYIPFTVDIDGMPSDVVFATYFDRIYEFSYDEQTRTISAVMPFTWTEEHIESASYIHAEYFIPKSISLFEDHEILLGVNGMDYFGTVDRSGHDTIVIHYLFSADKLRDMLETVEPPYEDVMVFEARAGDPRQQQINSGASLESGDTVIVMSAGGEDNDESFRLHLSAEPAGMINSGHDVTLSLEIRHAGTGELIHDSTYDLELILGDDVVESDAGREVQNGRDSIVAAFEDVGRATLAVSNIGGSVASGEFSFVVSEPHDMSAMDHGGMMMGDGTEQDEMAAMNDEMQAMMKEHEAMMKEHEAMMKEHEAMMSDDNDPMDIDAHMGMIKDHEAKISGHGEMVGAHEAIMRGHMQVMDRHGTGMGDDGVMMMQMHDEMMELHETMMQDHTTMSADHAMMRADHETMKQRHGAMMDGVVETPADENGGCLIATAAFGSELAPQVQQLRELRDNTVLATESGAAFMSGFNTVYYAFSPAVADLERENPAFREAVKAALTPMLSSLSLLSHADIDTESEMLGYGMAVALLNLGMYVGIPAFAAMQCTRLVRARLRAD